MRIIFDAENIANARTGIPKVSFLDAIVFNELGAQVELHVSEKSMSTLIKSAEFSQLSMLYAKRFGSNLQINSNRPSNSHIWKSRFYPHLRKKNLSNFDFSYTSLFPGLYNSVKDCTNIVRIHDPFRNRKTLLEEYRDATCWKNTFARVMRDRAFQSKLKDHSLVVANSFWTRRLCVEFYGLEESSIEVVWPSVGFRSEQIAERDSCHDTIPYLICVMSQRQRKKPVFVINAWAKVASRVGLHLRVVGNINYNDLSTLALKKIELGELVIYRNVNVEELKKLQRNAYASIFASTGEGFGLPIAESLFFGVPVLHNDLEVFREVSSGIGVEFSLAKEDSLIEGIESIAQSEESKLNLAKLSLERGSSFSHEFAISKWRKLLVNESKREM